MRVNYPSFIGIHILYYLDKKKQINMLTSVPTVNSSIYHQSNLVANYPIWIFTDE